MQSSAATISQAARERLLEAAETAALQAYAPYSRFRVGAALLLENGTIVTGANVENASYGLTICAERSAVVRAIAEQGPAIRIAAVAVANQNAAASPPCGGCRQVLAEFMADDAPVFFPLQDEVQQRTLAELLPLTFGLVHG